MSHNVDIGLRIFDLECLAKACEAIGAVLKRNQKTFKAYTRGTCDHAIGIPNTPNAYEIGVVARKDKGYDLTCDFWQGGYGLEAVVGPNAELLKQSYAAERTAQHYEQEFGNSQFRVTREKLEDGSIVLTAVR
jgi:hypothetical protein